MKHRSKHFAAHMAEERKNNNRISILTYVIFALVATIIFSGSTISKYTHLVQGYDEADAFVTTIYLTEDLYYDGSAEIVQSIDLEDMTPGTTLTKYIKIRSATPNAGNEITNVSTSPQSYSMEISSLGVLPLTFAITSHNMADGSQAGIIDDGVIATVNGALIQAGDNSNIYKLEIHWPESSKDEGYSGITDRITVRVRYQVLYESDVVVSAQIDKINTPVKAGDQVKMAVNLSQYENAYSAVSMSLTPGVNYDDNLLEFIGFEETDQFEGALIVSGDNAVSMLTDPYSVEDATKLSGGKLTTLVFIAKTDITADTPVSVNFEDVAVYTKGEADGWVETALVAVNVEAGGIYVG